MDEELRPLHSILLQSIVILVAENMGVLVIDVDDILARWKVMSYKLLTNLNNIALPLGHL